MLLRRLTRATALGAVGVMGAGCSWYHTHFPSRDEVFKPIPIAVGERRVSGADTSFAAGGDGFELVVPDRELLPEAKRALDYAAREYGRLFGAPPPPVVIEAAWRPEEKTARHATVERTYRRPDGRRALAVSVPRPPKDARRREAVLRYAPPLVAVAPAVARAWLSGRADGAPPRADGSAARAEWTLRDDPRLPDWLEDGVAMLIAPPSRIDLYDERLARGLDSLPGLAALFAATRPGAAGPAAPGDAVRLATEAGAGRVDGETPEEDARTRDPRRRRRPVLGRRVEGRGAFGPAERFAAQAHSVVGFLARREGAAYVGRAVDRVVDGEPIDRALGGARTLPSLAGDPSRVDLAALDRTWRAWLAQRDDPRGPSRP